MEQRQYLFDRFYRADEARTDTGHYGLGLAIAKAITERHHGSIQVLCENGLVDFSVHFPLQTHRRKGKRIQ